MHLEAIFAVSGTRSCYSQQTILEHTAFPCQDGYLLVNFAKHFHALFCKPLAYPIEFRMVTLKKS